MFIRQLYIYFYREECRILHFNVELSSDQLIVIKTCHSFNS